MLTSLIVGHDEVVWWALGEAQVKTEPGREAHYSSQMSIRWLATNAVEVLR